MLLVSTALSSAAWAVDVSTEAQLRNAIFAANGGGDSNINITANITLTQSLPMITASATFTGNNNTLDANSAGRGFFVQAGTVAVSNLTVNNAVANGGTGGNGVGGGGGGLGAGAAVFVNSGASASLSNVTVGSASATGGAGGSGGTSNGGGGGGGLGGAGGAGGISSGSGGGGGYAGAGGAGGIGNGGGGGEFGAGGLGGIGNSTGGGGGGGGQQGAGGTSTNHGGGGGAAPQQTAEAPRPRRARPAVAPRGAMAVIYSRPAIRRQPRWAVAAVAVFLLQAATVSSRAVAAVRARLAAAVVPVA